MRGSWCDDDFGAEPTGHLYLHVERPSLVVGGAPTPEGHSDRRHPTHPVGGLPVPAVTTSHDAAGRVTGTTSAAGSTAMTYDGWGRQLTYSNTPPDRSRTRRPPATTSSGRSPRSPTTPVRPATPMVGPTRTGRSRPVAWSPRSNRPAAGSPTPRQPPTTPRARSPWRSCPAGSPAGTAGILQGNWSTWSTPDVAPTPTPARRWMTSPGSAGPRPPTPPAAPSENGPPTAGPPTPPPPVPKR
ncbi:hypothetical protein ACFP57_02125 [Luteococcus sanguinis]|uniref:RHS repeat protein n=1 Tax=Luteococcus sanguinis TaxID=174038 RepID=A0ABW1WXF9_9ACTN